MPGCRIRAVRRWVRSPSLLVGNGCSRPTAGATPEILERHGALLARLYDQATLLTYSVDDFPSNGPATAATDPAAPAIQRALAVT